MTVEKGGFDLSFTCPQLSYGDSVAVRANVNVSTGSYTAYQKTIFTISKTGTLQYLLSVTNNAGTPIIYEAFDIDNFFQATFTTMNIRYNMHSEFLSVYINDMWVHTFGFFHVSYPDYDDLEIEIKPSGFSGSITNICITDLSDWREAVYIDFDSVGFNAVSSVIQQRPVEINPDYLGRVKFQYPNDDKRSPVTLVQDIVADFNSAKTNTEVISDAIVYGPTVEIVTDEDTASRYGFITKIIRVPDLDVGARRAALETIKIARQKSKSYTLIMRATLSIEIGDIVICSFNASGTNTKTDVICIVETVEITIQNGVFGMTVTGRDGSVEYDVGSTVDINGSSDLTVSGTLAALTREGTASLVGTSSLVTSGSVSVGTSAVIHYVDKDATGSNNGTSWANAWESFASIDWNSITHGDTIYISDGTYSETLTIGKSGTAGQLITIDVGANSPSPSGHDGVVIIDGGNTRSSGINFNGKSYIKVNGYYGISYKLKIQNTLENFSGDAALMVRSCSSIDIYYVEVINGTNRGIYADYTSNLTIRGCDIRNGLTADSVVQTDCIYVGSGCSDVDIDNNICILGNKNTAAHVDPLQVYNATRVTVRNNYLESPTGIGASDANTPIMISNIHEWCLLYNNVALGDDHADGMEKVVLFSPGGLGASYYFWNNTFVSRVGGGVIEFMNFVDSDLAEFKNNILYTVGDARDPYEHYIFGATASITASKINNNCFYRTSGSRMMFSGSNLYNTWAEYQAAGFDPDGINADPVFVTNLTDVHIQADSPCKNIGADLSAHFIIDKDGISRPTGQWDIGAYEASTEITANLIGSSSLITSGSVTETSGTNHYVDKDASGSNNGTSWTDAWESFADINWNNVSPGDTVYISDGTYYETLTIPKSGASGQPITIDVGANSPSPSGHDGIVVIDGGGTRSFGITNYYGGNGFSYIDVNGWSGGTYKLHVQNCMQNNDGDANVMFREADHCNIDYIKITNNTCRGIFWFYMDDCRIKGCDVETGEINNEYQTDCIYLGQCYDNIVEDNLCIMNQSGSYGHVDTIQMVQCSRAIIRNNAFMWMAIGIPGNQILQLQEGVGWHYFYNNIFYGNNQAVICLNAYEGGCYYFWNNTFVGNFSGAYGLAMMDIYEDDIGEVKNNIFYTLDGYGIYCNNADPFTGKIDYNCYWYQSSGSNVSYIGHVPRTWAQHQAAGYDTHGIHQDPKFVVEFTDLRLQSDSPLRDVGADLSAYFTTDFNGNTRPVGQWDIGAYEETTVEHANLIGTSGLTSSGSVTGSGATVIYKDGFGGDKTTYIDTNLNSTAPSGTDGTSGVLYWGGWAVGVYAGLIKFDFSGIPDGVTLNYVRFYYYRDSSYGTDATMKIGRVLAASGSWTELGASWNHAVEDTIEWAGGNNGCGVSGVDHSGSPLFLGNPPKVPGYNYVELDLIEFALMKANNYGMILLSQGPNDGNYIFIISSDGIAEQRPYIEVSYEPSGEASAVLSGTSILTVSVITTHNATVTLTGTSALTTSGSVSEAVTPPIFDIDYEANNFSEWDYAESGSYLYTSGSAALGGTNYGLAVVCDGVTYKRCENAMTKVNVFRYRVYFDPNSLSMAEDAGVAFVSFTQNGGSWGGISGLMLYWEAAWGYYLQVYLTSDNNVESQDTCVITDAPHYIEVEVTRSSGSSANNGTLQWWVDGVDQGTITGVDNYNRMIDANFNFRVGTMGYVGTISGTVYVDQIILNDTGNEIGPI